MQKKKNRVRVTEEDLYTADYITAEMAAAYVGNISAHSARVLARSGRIGEPVPDSNRVIIQPSKLIDYKKGGCTDIEKFQVATRVFKDAGFSDAVQALALALIRVVGEHPNLFTAND